jgi:hypothetical protein
VANPITSDNFSAQQPLKQRNPDAGPVAPQQPLKREVEPEAASDRTALDRAQRRLSQDAVSAGSSSSVDAADAKHLAATVKNLINAAPKAALAAHVGIDGNAFEAAMTQPTT